jgi:ATP-binding cassette subfamily B protein
LVGERGITLSGGQKQRVAIARTLLKDPRILILDDSTSSVDTETEAEIRGALRTLMQGRTTFIIAHRIQSVMNADHILVLDGGRVVQHGTHEQLVNQPGAYRRIFEAQTRVELELEEEINRVNGSHGL